MSVDRLEAISLPVSDGVLVHIQQLGQLGDIIAAAGFDAARIEPFGKHRYRSPQACASIRRRMDSILTRRRRPTFIASKRPSASIA